MIIDHVIGKLSIINQALTGWMNRIEVYWKGRMDEHNRSLLEREKGLYYSTCEQITKYSSRQSVKEKTTIQPSNWKMDILLGNITHHIEDFSLPGT